MSKVSDAADIMRKLLWTNLVKAWALKAITVVPFLGWPIVKDVFFFILEKTLIDDLFMELSRFGVFTSIDWQSNEEYEAYKKEAEKLVPLQSTPEWPLEERKKFREAASALIHFHIIQPKP